MQPPFPSEEWDLRDLSDATAGASELAAPQLRCREIRCTAELDALEPEYQALYRHSSNATIYLSWPWIRTWWHIFGGRTTTLRVMAFYDGQELVGCAPLVERRPAGLPARRLEPMGVLRSDYMDLLLGQGREQAVLQAFTTYLASRTDWDVLDLQQLPETSPTLAHFRDRVPGCNVMEQEICPYAPLPATWDTFLKGLGRKNRYNAGYYRRMVERDFRVNIGRVDASRLDDSMQELFRLHQLRWRKRRLPGALFDVRVRRFHQGVAAQLLAEGKLDLYRLDLDEKPAALLYCFAENGRGYYYLGGFDPDYAKHSVGTVLTAFAIQESIARGHRVFDFLRGNEAYKYRWNVTEARNYRVEWARPGVNAAFLSGLAAVTRRIEHAAKQIAHRLESA